MADWGCPLAQDNFNLSDPLGAGDTDKRFTFDLSLPAPEVPFEIPPVEGLDPLDGQAVDPIISHVPTYSDTQLSAPAMIGTYDSYAGIVTKVYDAAADSEWNQKGVIEVRRASPYWTGGGVFGMDEIPPVDSQPQRSTEHAFPFPAIDQQLYRVAEDDPVVIVTGRDGKCYYLPDDRPFIGVVAQSPGSASTKEANFGGAGNTTIKVTRQLLSGNPTAGIPTFAAITAITYNYVYPIVPAGQHHGHRVGDTVLCVRRGMYMFCLPSRGIWHGKIVAAGPASEADFADERYWVEILAVNVAYTGDTNVWDWEADGTSPFTVEAANAAEITAGTHVVAAGTEVIVTLMADTTSAQKYPYFVFTHANTPVLWGVPKANPTATAVSTILLVPCSKAGVATGAADVRVFIRDDRSTVLLHTRKWLATVTGPPLVIGTILSYVPLAETVAVGEGTVGGVLVGEGPFGPPVEWGHPYSAGNTGSVATIDLVTCDQNGTTLAEDITVYLRNDHSAVEITLRAWTQSTILSFVRSVKNSADVSGVLVGEDRHEGPVGGVPIAGPHHASGTEDPFCHKIRYYFDGYGHCIGWYYYDYGTSAEVWETPWGVAEPA